MMTEKNPLKMKKNKLELTYKREVSPQEHTSALLSADENDLRVLLYISMLPDGEPIEKEDICEALELDGDAFDASVKYWCGTGLLKRKKSSAKKEKPESEKKTEKSAARSAIGPAHKNGLLERGSALPSYSSDELSAIMESRAVTVEFIHEAQRLVGKVFNTHEIGILVGMVDYIGFDENSVLLILSYLTKHGKKSLHYAEKVAFGLYDEGITTTEALEACFRKRDEDLSVENAVRAMFGMTGRALTTNEKKYLDSWIKVMGFDIEVIRMAYDITVDKTHEPTPKYANSILESWYSKGLRTRADVEEAQKEYASKKSGTQQRESFVVDEFFEAALRRSFEELK